MKLLIDVCDRGLGTAIKTVLETVSGAWQCDARNGASIQAEELSCYNAIILEVDLIANNVRNWKRPPYRDACPDSSDDATVSSWCRQMRPIIYVGFGTLPDEQGAHLFLDSSIWHRYVNLLEADYGIDQLSELFENIKKWHDLHLYDTTVALESLDYSLRTLTAQVLRNFKKGGHGEHISLHPFASERVAASKAKEESVKDLSEYRFLLVDDYANKSLGLADGTDGTGVPSKLEVIAKIFETDRFNKESVQRAESNQAAVVALSVSGGSVFDVILLDYLLGPAASGKGREFGTALIKDKKKLHTLPHSRGPGEHYWVFPMTAFPAAFMAELQRGGVETISDACFVAVGADPVCTPELFRWQLLRFLDTQRKYLEKAIASDDVSLKYFGMIELGKSENEDTAKNVLSHLTQRKERLKSILADSEKGSGCAKEVIKDTIFKGMAAGTFDSIFPYLESYIRMLAYHSHHAKDTMLRDLEVMRQITERMQSEIKHKASASTEVLPEGTASVQPENDHKCPFIKWLDTQRKNILSK